jgi:CRISPR-associated protein Cmr6
MPVAAVPDYMPKALLGEASPSLRFGMYLQLWGIDLRSKALLWSTHDIKYETRGQEKRERPVPVETKRAALDLACPLTTTDKKTMLALVARQQATAAPLIASGALMRIEAMAVAPFTTGLGNEHPLENGFAFLNPYGLPYLPGSGVKGVVRQAARELAEGEWGDGGGWSFEKIYQLTIGKGQVALSSLDVLLGRDIEAGETTHVRGALSFWDVIPVIEGDRVTVEVMTPHQSHYYQDGATPHESGSPIPITFLTVPPKSNFAFHVLCDRAHLRRLAPQLAEGDRWKELTEKAFNHAFQWLGFGAKTSVGYGAIKATIGAAAAPHAAVPQMEAGKVRLASPAESKPPAGGAHTAGGARSSDEMVWDNARLKYNAQNGTLTATGLQNTQANALAPRGEQLLLTLPQDIQQKVRANHFVQVVARVRRSNLIAVEPKR